MALQKMPLTINGVDFSALTERCGYSIVYEARQGGNSMTMLNGDQYTDIITRRPVLTWRLDSLTNTQLALLLTAVHAAPYVEVEYFDTESNSVKTAVMTGSVSGQEVGVLRSDYYRFRAPTLTMRAR